MAEMITGYPLFRGRDNNDQLVQIMKIVGTPSEATLAQIKANSVRFVAGSEFGPARRPVQREAGSGPGLTLLWGRADTVARDPDEVALEQARQAALCHHHPQSAS
jgi:hypothetical protein